MNNFLLKISATPLLLLTCICHATHFLDLSDFETEIQIFLKEHHMPSILQGQDKVLLDKEFLLIEEFADLQLSRQRPLISGMDRDERWAPYKENKVTLQDRTEMSASYIQLAQLEDGRYHRFIASQAPFKEVIHHFWKMIWENQVDQVVMLTELADTPDQEASASYWPENEQEPLVLQNGMKVELIEDIWFFTEMKTRIQKRKFLVIYEGQQRIVNHYWYHGWIDHTIPDQPKTLLTLIQTVSHDKQQLHSSAPILVHCAGGVGRTGIFITLYHIKQRQFYAESVNLFKIGLQLRWQRPRILSKAIAYHYCHEMISLIEKEITAE